MDKHDDCGWRVSIFTIAAVFLVAAKLSGSITWGWLACTSPAWGAVAVYTLLQLLRLATWCKRNTSPIPAEGNL